MLGIDRIAMDVRRLLHAANMKLNGEFSTFKVALKTKNAIN